MIARFDDNLRSPLFVEKTLGEGEGKVLLFTTAIDAEWSESMIGRAPYLVIMWSLSEYLASRPASRRNLPVGRPVQILLPMSRYAPAFDLVTPDGAVVTVPAKRLERTKKWFLVEYPTQTSGRGAGAKSLQNVGVSERGLYALVKKDAGEMELPLAYFACNVSPADTDAESLYRCEGNLERMSWEEIQERYPDFKCEKLGEKRKTTAEMDIAPPPGGIWRSLLYLLLGFVLLETFLAWFFGRAKS